MRRIPIALLAALATSLIFAAAAPAATSIGGTAVPGIDNLPDPNNWAVSTSTLPSNAVPAGGGVITGFSHIAEAMPDATIALIVMRPVAGGYYVVGKSDAHAEIANQLNVFGTRIAVQQGDLIGVAGDTANLAAATNTGVGGDVFKATSAVLTAGITVPDAGISTYNGYTLEVAASVEPDADSDGYGDETQDTCKTDPTTFAACQPPVLKLTAKPQKAKSTFKLTVSSNEIANLNISGKLKGSGKGAKSVSITKAKTGLTAGQKKTLKLKLGSKAKKALARYGKAKVKLTIKATDAYGAAKTYKKTVNLKLKLK